MQRLKSLWRLPQYRLAFAAAVVLLVTVPFVLTFIGNGGVERAKSRVIDQNIQDITFKSRQGISPSTDKHYAAVRAGVLVEDLRFLTGSGGNDRLIKKSGELLSADLRLIQGTTADFVIPDPAGITGKNIGRIVDEIRKLVEKKSLLELFQLGRFVERVLLSTFDAEPEVPGVMEVIKYRGIAAKHQQRFGREMVDWFDRLKTDRKAEEIRKTCWKIKALFC